MARKKKNGTAAEGKPPAETGQAEGVDPVPPSTQEAPAPFPVVGIGTSAGGLEAMEAFFAHMPAAAQLAFLCPLRVLSSRPVRKSQICTVSSLLPETSRLPSGLNAMAEIQFWCPRKGKCRGFAFSLFLARCMPRIVPGHRRLRRPHGLPRRADEPYLGQHSHLGEGDFRSEVANFSRNVIVESANPEGIRGHTMYHAGSAGSVSYAEFRHLGKEGVLGRYSLHFHLCGDTLRGSSVIALSIDVAAIAVAKVFRFPLNLKRLLPGRRGQQVKGLRLEVIHVLHRTISQTWPTRSTCCEWTWKAPGIFSLPVCGFCS